MAFTWKRYSEIAARLRVLLGFVLLLLYAAFARPTPSRALAGAAIALGGMVLRTLAAGYLDKNRKMATGGPYAYTRNPLYLGTALVAAGFALAGGLWWMAAVLALFLVAIYLPVVGEEEAHLAKLFPEYRDYAARVPRFWRLLTGNSKRLQSDTQTRNQFGDLSQASVRKALEFCAA